MGAVTEEVLQHLTTLPGAEVEVSAEISAKVPDGVGRTVRRIVEENCRTLRFRSHRFEDEKAHRDPVSFRSGRCRGGGTC